MSKAWNSIIGVCVGLALVALGEAFGWTSSSALVWGPSPFSAWSKWQSPSTVATRRAAGGGSRDGSRTRRRALTRYPPAPVVWTFCELTVSRQRKPTVWPRSTRSFGHGSANRKLSRRRPV